MFKERKTKFTLLSLLSALVVASTAFVGISIYAQTDDGDLTTFEEEEMASEDTTNATSDNATEGNTSTAADLSILDGLVVCDMGSAEISGETQTASANSTEGTPTVSATVMSETEVAELAANETETAAETSNASASCLMLGDGEASGSTADEANATSTAGNATGDATSSNMTGADNATSTESSGTAANTSDTSTSSISDREILVIEGQDFAPGEVVLMFTENALVGIDDVDDSGEIEAKIPMPESETAIAGNDTATTELRLLETGTQRTATFEFDGQTLTAAEGGDIEAAEGGDEGSEASMPELAPSGNATSTNSTSTSNSTNATMQ